MRIAVTLEGTDYESVDIADTEVDGLTLVTIHGIDEPNVYSIGALVNRYATFTINGATRVITIEGAVSAYAVPRPSETNGAIEITAARDAVTIGRRRTHAKHAH